MSDIPLTFENIPFTWGIAFALDIAMGATLFAIIFRQNTPPWARAACCWIGWWAWASAFALVINVVLGTPNPFSYHQIGIVTESMVNLGFMWWLLMLTAKNWYLRGRDFQKIEELRAKIYMENMKAELRKSYDDIDKHKTEMDKSEVDKSEVDK